MSVEQSRLLVLACAAALDAEAARAGTGSKSAQTRQLVAMIKVCVCARVCAFMCVRVCARARTRVNILRAGRCTRAWRPTVENYVRGDPLLKPTYPETHC